MVYSTPPSFSDRNAGRLAWLAYLHLSSDFQRFRLLGDLLSVSQLFSFLSFFLSLEFIFNINSNKTSLAIAYSVFQQLSTAHRDNRPHCSRMIDLLPSSPLSSRDNRDRENGLDSRPRAIRQEREQEFPRPVGSRETTPHSRQLYIRHLPLS